MASASVKDSHSAKGIVSAATLDIPVVSGEGIHDAQRTADYDPRGSSQSQKSSQPGSKGKSAEKSRGGMGRAPLGRNKMGSPKAAPNAATLKKNNLVTPSPTFGAKDKENL